MMFLWLLEDVAPKKIVMMTKKRFVRDYYEFSHKYTRLQGVFLNFLRFRLKALPTQTFNAKDSTMVTAPGFRRCHLIHGKAILIYRLEGNQIQLCAIVEHNSVETGKELAYLDNYLENLTPENFEPAAEFEAAAENDSNTTKKLSPQEIEDVKTVIWALAAQDKSVLTNALNGDLDGFIEYVLIGADDIKLSEEELFAALKATFTKEQFNSLITGIMNQVKD